VFCDLDGTLVLDNSFHIFMASAWVMANAVQRLALSSSVLPRALGRFSGGHAGLKKRVLARFSRQPQLWQASVIQMTMRRLQVTLSQPVLAALRAYAGDGADIVLATAAPDIYARPLAQSIGATDCIATSADTTTGWQELLAQRKAEACKQWLAPQTRHVIVLTDHADDLALLRMADEAVIVGPMAQFNAIHAQLSHNPPVLHHIDTDAGQNHGGYWLWFDDRPSGPHDRWEIKTILSKHRYAQIYQGNGQWRRIGPGMALLPAVLRRECPRPPNSRQRLMVHINRRVQRDWLRVFH
jgi:phosphoserine phosphatase